VAFDLADEAQVQAAISRNAGGRRDRQMLVNNAGLHRDALMAGWDSDWTA
jgi:NADP-dependent 3-hydroxy acid dehydrogenase YdfG